MKQLVKMELVRRVQLKCSCAVAIIKCSLLVLGMEELTD